MLGLDNIRKKRCVLIYPINKMYAIPEKTQYQMIKLKYTVRGIDLKTNREGLKRKKNRCKFLSKRAFSYLYVINPLASHMSFYL
jgi:hypothetical protein